LQSFISGCDEEPLRAFGAPSRSKERNPIRHFYLWAALANLGRLDETKSAVAAGQALNPGFSISRWRETAPKLERRRRRPRGRPEWKSRRRRSARSLSDGR
jgi:hypothetical protein